MCVLYGVFQSRLAESCGCCSVAASRWVGLRCSLPISFLCNHFVGVEAVVPSRWCLVMISPFQGCIEGPGGGLVELSVRTVTNLVGISCLLVNLVAGSVLSLVVGALGCVQLCIGVVCFGLVSLHLVSVGVVHAYYVLLGGAL